MPAPVHPLEPIVQQIITNNPSWGPSPVREFMERICERERLSKDGLPSIRTISRIKKRLTETQKIEFGYVVWPDTFAAGLLPFEASRAVLDIMVRQPITVRRARYHWWVTLGTPDLSATAEGREIQRDIGHWLFAMSLVPGGLSPKSARTVERYMALRAWELSPNEYYERSKAIEQDEQGIPASERETPRWDLKTPMWQPQTMGGGAPPESLAEYYGGTPAEWADHVASVHDEANAAGGREGGRDAEAR